MTVLEALKAKSLQLRKERSSLASSITFAISEIERVGKNDGNRATTNDEAIRVVQKLIASIENNLAVIKGTGDTGRLVHFNAEKTLLEAVLPKMLSESETRSAVLEAAASAKNKGEVMKSLRAKYGSLIDLKLAGSIYDEK